MEMTQIIKIGKDLGLQGTELLNFIERKEKETLDREERKEKEALEREERKEKERLEREDRLEKERAERDERVKAREDKIRELELENENRLKVLEFEKQAKIEILEKQSELEKTKVQVIETDKELSIKHKQRGPKLPYFEDGKDDMDAYLHRFERFAESVGWPQKDWAVSLGALLKGKALEVYSRLSSAEANEYGKVKQALLKRFELTQEGFRQKFRSCQPEKGESAPQFAYRLENYLIRWIELSGTDKSFNGLKDLLLREQFINASQRNLALFLKERKPGNISEMAELAEQFLEAHDNQFMYNEKLSVPGKKLGYPDKHENKGKVHDAGGKHDTTKGNVPRTCYYCKKQGHEIKDCFERQKILKSRGGKQAAGIVSVDELRNDQIENEHVNKSENQACACYSGDMWEHECCIHDNKVRLECGHELPLISALCKNRKYTSMPVVEGILNNKIVSVLRDSGCSSVVVKQDLVKEEQFTGRSQRCVLIDGTVRDAPVASIWVDTPYFEGRTEALCMSEPIYDLILGNIPGVREPNRPNSNWGRHNLVKRESNPVKTEINCSHKDKRSLDYHEIETNNRTGGAVTKVKGENVVDIEPKLQEEAVSSKIEVQAVQTRGQKLKEGKSFQKLKVMKGLEVRKDEFKEDQSKDETLNWIRERAKREEKKIRKGTVSWFCIRNQLLYHCFQNNKTDHGKTQKQLVVPKSYRTTVLKLAHESILGGHLGMKKTTDKIRLQFFWPGLQQDVKLYCLSCDLCQKTFPKGKVTRVPLDQMPLIETPFERVAVDLVGPIQPVTEKKNRYILTLVDYATRYPEAVPLPGIEAERVAEALFNMFTRLGFPSEILTDLGTQFTSEVMKELSRLLSIRMLKTTAYHPICNGLVEKFNGTLKSMLRKVCAEKPKDWDRYIPALLFAYREAPQESLGFSPFELLYGRTVRGPMAILKDLWTDDVQEPEVRTTYQYILDLRQRLEDTLEVARKELEKSASRYKKHYDRKSKLRKFESNDDVLILLPTDGNKLLMQWKGPFKVVDKVGKYDYKVYVNGKVKVFHANLLKKYVSREEETEKKYVNDRDGSVSEIQTQGLLEIVCAGVIDCGVESIEDSQANEPGNEDELLELPDFEGKETVADVRINPNLSETQTEEVRNLLKEFTDVLTDVPGETNLVEHKIKLTSDQPVRTKQYPLPFAMTEIIKEETKKMLDMGIIEPSNSAYMSPVVLVKKSDQSIRFCIDFRNLNKLTKFDAEPIPIPEEIFSKLSNCKYFTKIDLSKGYWQIKLTEDSKEKTAFGTPDGLFQFRKLPFGLVTAPANFSRMMRLLLKGLIDIDNFIDDILEHTVDWNDHLVKLRELLQRLRQAGLTARPSKCMVGFTSVEFLGHRVGEGVLTPNQNKVKDIVEAKRPETKKQVQSFLGMVGFYRKFIPQFAEIALPLTNLTKKGCPNKVVWEDEHQRSFEKLKSYMTHTPILRLPDLNETFILRTDASNVGLGAVLMQKFNDMNFPIAYASKKLLPRETRYSVIERECLALVWGVRKFQMYLYGREFQVETDHCPLIYMQNTKLTNSRIMRWVLSLQQYRFRLVAIKGSQNIGADYMSRSEK